MSGNRLASSTQRAGGRAVKLLTGGVSGLGGLHPILWEALVCVAPAPACPGGTYTLLLVHRADAAEGVPIAHAGLQASLQREARG